MMRRLRLLGLGGALALTMTIMPLLAPGVAPVTRAVDPAPCRVRNVTQGTFGHSLIRMVERARDGDVLRVRGTCGRGGTIIVDTDITIVGEGDVPRLTGRNDHRVLEIERGAQVSLRHLTIAHGWAHWRRGAGGILNRGDLTVEDSVIRRNEETGIVHVGGRLLLRRVVVAENHTRFSGGGIVSTAGRARAVDSVVRANTAEQGGGGGIFNANWASVQGAGPMMLVRTQVTGNAAGDRGGGIENWGTLRLIDSTVTGNTAVRAAGGIFNDSSESIGTVILDGTSAVSGNIPDDCVGTDAC